MKSASFPAVLFIVPALMGALPAFAAGGAGNETTALPGFRLEVAITLYAGGITMGHMDLDATQRVGDYHSVSILQTSGVINSFWHSEIQATTSGNMGAK